MNKQQKLANKIIYEISETIEEHYPEIKPKCITDDEIENPALINGTVYYDLECKIADDIKALNKKDMEIFKVIMHDLECLEIKKTKDNIYHYDLLVGNLKDLFGVKGGFE